MAIGVTSSDNLVCVWDYINDHVLYSFNINWLEDTRKETALLNRIFKQSSKNTASGAPANPNQPAQNNPSQNSSANQGPVTLTFQKTEKLGDILLVKFFDKTARSHKLVFERVAVSDYNRNDFCLINLNRQRLQPK